MGGERDAVQWADVLLAAHRGRGLVEPITAAEPGFDLARAGDVLDAIASRRRADGWMPIGRKIGFTNRSIWPLYGVDAPMWAHVWDRTVRFTAGEPVIVAVDDFVQPRIEPEVVVGLGADVAPSADVEDLVGCLAWIAAGFEVVQCHFPEWRFGLADSAADFGLHGTLIVGERVELAGHLPGGTEALAEFEVALMRDGATVDRGVGANVLGSPLLALHHLVTLLATRGDRLSAGEVVTTGTLTDAWPIAAGERWVSDYGTLGVPGIELECVGSAAASPSSGTSSNI